MNYINQNRIIAKVLKEKLPCDGCKHEYRCGLDLMACESFKVYVSTGRYNKDRPMEPSREMYMKVFWDNNSDVEQIWEHIDA